MALAADIFTVFANQTFYHLNSEMFGYGGTYILIMIRVIYEMFYERKINYYYG